MTIDSTPEAEPRVLVTPEDLIGFVIAERYRLDSLVGEGGMGVVFRSHQPGLHRDIAVKLLKPSGVQGPKREERFQREIAIIAALSHPNIVRVFDSGVDERLGLHYIAMELVDGVSLDKVLRNHTVQPELALEICYQMCGALTEPHAHGIIHRDIKPENTLISVMSDETIQVKILDFGIARSHTADGGRLTTTGVVMGTPRYMSPESVQGGELDARTDLYAVGVILYEMFVGRVPFAGTTPVATMIEHVTKPAPSLDEAVPGFKYPEISALVKALLAKAPNDRPASAREVRDRIDAIRDKYGFGRLRVRRGHPLGALLPWLADAEGNDEVEDEFAGSYDATAPMREGSQATDSSMIPVPARVARAHFKEMGWSKPLPDVSTELAAVTEAVSLDAGEVPKRANNGLVVALGVAVVLAALVLAFLLQSDPEPVTISVTPEAHEAPVTAVQAAEEVKVSAVDKVVVAADAGSDTGDVGGAVASEVVERPVVKDKPTNKVREVKPPEKVEEKVEQKPEPPKVDAVQQGLEWLEKN